MSKQSNLFKVLWFLFLTLNMGFAQADSLFGEFKRVPDEIERGFYISGDFGSMIFSGAVNGTNPGETADRTGSHLGFTMGYDIGKNFAVESVYTLGIHTASPSDPNLEGGVNTFIGNLGLRAHIPIGRLYPFAFIGGGIVRSQPQFKDENNTRSIMASAGLEYYTLLRHYSLYARISYFNLDLPVDAITVSGGLKYTF